MAAPTSPPPATRSGEDELPAYVSNGVIGLRVLDIPLLPGKVMVSGFAGIHPEKEIEAAAEAPYPLAGDLFLNGVPLSRAPHQARFVEQRHDFSNGELTTRFEFAAGGATALVEVLTVCSRERPSVVLQEVTLEVDTAADVVLRALVDTSKIHGRNVARHTQMPGDTEHAVDGSMEWESLGARGTVGVAYVTELLGEADATRSVASWGVESDLATDYAWRAQRGRRYRLRQIASVVPSVLHHDPDHQALRLVASAAADGFERLRDENRRVWDDLWRGRIVIDASEPRWQELADAAFFYLNSSVHASASASTSIFGLATWDNYHYYYGHVMWDIELFGVPPLLFQQPEAARNLLQFRVKTIEAARSNAKLNGRQGLQFPWESGPTNGEESSPGVGEAAWHEDHVSVDIAWAFAQYAHATGDRRFIAEDASRVLYGVADWIASRVTRTRSGYAWRQTMGVAERERATDNDAFTIMGARNVLREAIDCARLLGDPVRPAWEAVLDGLDVRPSPSLGVILSHDGFNPREEKGATPGPLAGLFPFWYPADPAVERATLDYYLKLADEYVGSPMLSPLYGVWASWAGDRRLAARLYDEGYAQLIGPRFLQTLEVMPTKFPETPDAGPFFANLSGFLMGLLFGLPGIKLGPGEPESWPSRPVILPAGWKSIEVERAWMRDQPGRIVAEHGAERAIVSIPGSGRGIRRVA